MAIRVAIHHLTTYHYDRAIRLGPQTVRLRPAPHCRSHVRSYSLRVRPEDHFINWQQDPWSNYLARLVFQEPARSLELEVDIVADLAVVNPFDFFLEPEAELFPFEYEDGLRRSLAPYLELGDWGPLFTDYLAKIDRQRRKAVDFVVDLNRHLERDLDYSIRLDPGLRSPEETLAAGGGACRDFAWLEVQLLRHLGLAARFASGYSVQLVADTKPLEGPAGVAADVVDLHAWAEVFLPGAGWIGLDPTSGLLAGEGHIPLACSPEPEDAAPISGELEECEAKFKVAMEVQRLEQEPRTSKPYDEEAWQAILACGDAVEDRLEQQDVRLTVGGEPTFVSVDDYTGDEWTVAAVGPTKRRLAEELIGRLRDRFAPGGVLHYGQGKWYPGESLPRWALTCTWREDGQPLWRDKKWIADPQASGHASAEDAERFLRTLASRLGVDPGCALPAYEDTAYYLWREGRLPTNVDPLDNRLSDPEERARLARVFDRGLGTPAGWVLPLGRSSDSTGEPRRMWHSSLWMLRSQHLFLSPGDSPVGLRLPLDALPWVDPKRSPGLEPLDPTAPRGPLPTPSALGQPVVFETRAQVRQQTMTTPESKAAEESELPRTALCVEPRQGQLHVFLPPLAAADDFVHLLEAVEDTAAALDERVILEGYPIPTDPRLRSIKVTPDPGVIEVNVHPAGSWRELVDITTGVYEEARLVRLGPEKFLVGGRRVGTGGGNHVVLGGPTPLDSPFLRSPHLLRSLLTYWNNHPSLSYLFSSQFLGPTSQHPRIDEARQDQLYELEIAFELATRESPVPPWIVDRLFRDLLVDVSGNTHRTEFCIDKLYSPDSASGRLGLVELRAYEMPPHPRMAVAQQLLIRALIAHFWAKPCDAPLVRWGTELHDRFLLPHWVRQDFKEVLDDLERAGLGLLRTWFHPHFEFRFPRIGTLEAEGLEIELRHALEPWHVLGEDSVPGGAVRYVDSSLERIQIRVAGMTESRHVVACNGRRLPLSPTGRRGEFIAGVRFRAWHPSRCLHPIIPIHTPLVFDLVDTWSNRSVAGCRYHVSHPGGRNCEEPPVNAYEAEARRRALFEPLGHTPGSMRVEKERPHPEAPHTLDLRRRPAPW